MLNSNVILTLFLVITVGTMFGAIPFGPIRFGAAGALFMGLVFGSFLHIPKEDLTVFQELGLGVFVYMIGLEAGETFFRDMKKQLGLMVAGLVATTIGAVVAVVAGGLLGISREVSVGAFAGSLTSTPSLQLAQEQTGSGLPAVGYSLGYPTGVALSILLVALTINRSWKAKKDKDESGEEILRPLHIAVGKDVDMHALEEELGDHYVMSAVRRKGKTLIAAGDCQQVHRGDVVSLMTTKAAAKELTERLGHRTTMLPFMDRRVTVQHFHVSNKDIAGNKVGNLPLYANYRARIVKVRRGDDEFLANDDTYLESGDVVEVALPVSRRNDIESYFGNSVQSFSELDWIAVAGGLFLGYLAALITIPLPGSSFALGAAAGPLIVGMILGAVQRTGRTAWQVPRPANFTLRQLGLQLFLAAVGVASGPAFAQTAFSKSGLITVVLAVIIALITCGFFLLVMYFMGQSAPRANGGVAGVLGQPAVLQFALESTSDSRVMSGYTATFAIALIYKIVIVPVMLAV